MPQLCFDPECFSDALILCAVSNRQNPLLQKYFHRMNEISSFISFDCFIRANVKFENGQLFH